MRSKQNKGANFAVHPPDAISTSVEVIATQGTMLWKTEAGIIKLAVLKRGAN